MVAAVLEPLSQSVGGHVVAPHVQSNSTSGRYVTPTCSTKPARCASSRTCSISSNPRSGSPHARILLASRAVSVSPRSSASRRARFPHSVPAAHPSVSPMFLANLAYAFTSSRPAGSGSSTATASRAARADSSVRPGHQRISPSRLNERPSPSLSPSARRHSSASSRAAIASSLWSVR